MKKVVLVCAAMCAAVAFTSCGASKESAYRKAYEKAKAQEQASVQQTQGTVAAQEQSPVVTPLVEATQQPVVDNNDNVAVRTESVSVVSGAGLKAYSVVVGSFGVRANAEGLASTLTKAGYNAQIAYNGKMYRVVASTFDAKSNAVESRNSLRATYPDAWLLMKQ